MADHGHLVRLVPTPGSRSGLADEALPDLDQRWEELTLLAQWASTRRTARTFGDVVQLCPGLGPLPPDLLTAWEALSEQPVPVAADPVADAYGLLDYLSGREREILYRRVLAGCPQVLDDVGALLGVSRSRVAQIQHKAEHRLVSALRTRPYRPLGWLLADLRAELGTICPVGRAYQNPVLQAAAAYWETVSDRTVTGVADPGTSPRASDLEWSTGQFQRLLLFLAGPYSERDGELTIDRNPHDLTLDSEHDNAVLDAPAKRTTPRDLDERPPRRPLANPVTAATGIVYPWHNPANDWRGTLVDRALTVLTALGHPAKAGEIAAEIGENVTGDHLGRRLRNDARITRTDDQHYALAAWA